jgi:hypothetical protein
MAQDRPIDAARSLSWCLVLSYFHHLLKVLRYSVLGSGTFASLSSPDCRFSDASLRKGAATKMGDGLAARFFSWKHVLKLLAAIDLANTRFACGGDEAFHIQQTMLAAYWFFVLGACIHLVISGELAPEERVRVAESGLATALITFLQRSVVPPSSGPARLGTGVMPGRRPLRHCRSTSSRCLSSLSSSHVSFTQFVAVFSGQLVFSGEAPVRH